RRRSRELSLRLLLGVRLQAIHGFAAVSVEAAFSRAMELSAEGDPDRDRLLAHWGLFGCHVVRANLVAAAGLTESLAELAHRLDQGLARVAAGYMLGVTSFYRGELGAARSALNEALDLWDTADRDECLLLYGHDLSVGITAYLGWVLALQGDPTAGSAAARAIELGRDAADPFSIAYATTFAAQTHLFRDDLAEAKGYALATKAMAFERGYAQWQGQADIQLGHIAERQHRSAGMTAMQQGLDQYVSTGAALALPYTRAFLAEAHTARGEPEQAAAMIRQGLSETALSGEHYYDAELLRLDAELSADRGDALAALETLKHARVLADTQGACLLAEKIELVRERIDADNWSKHE
ncbi:MAG: hypothetical protein GXP35_06580, partial [Actinobacteria bacterium]|nr:hypothetical protein [Actinomycetota bacterium]